jgi:serine/threonine protein kinase
MEGGETQLDGRFVLLVELCEQGDLLAMVEASEAAGAVLDPLFVQRVVVQMLLAVAHMHSLQIAHRDLKLSNVYITSTGDVKVQPAGAMLKMRLRLRRELTLQSNTKPDDPMTDGCGVKCAWRFGWLVFGSWQTLA